MCLFEHEVVCQTNNVKLAFLLELKYCSGLLPHSTKHRLLFGIVSYCCSASSILFLNKELMLGREGSVHFKVLKAFGKCL